MSGREDSVIERFRKDLRNECKTSGAVDMNAPANGGDRYLNADEFFAAGNRFFIVEFKSRKFDLKSEDRKPSACALCGRLAASAKAKELHDMAHFAAWAEKERKGNLKCFVGVYRLSITHNFYRDHESEFNIGKAHQPTPHHDVARRRIARAREVAAQACQFEQVGR